MKKKLKSRIPIPQKSPKVILSKKDFNKKKSRREAKKEIDSQLSEINGES